MLTLIMSWLAIQLGKQGRVVPMEMIGLAIFADIFGGIMSLYALQTGL